MRSVILALILFCSYSQAFAASTLKKIHAAKELRVCSDAGFLPFEMLSASGEWTGYDIDMMRSFAKHLNVKLTMVQYQFDGIIPALLSGKCDMIAAGMTVTPDREKVVQFSDTVFTNGISVVTRRDSNKKMCKSLLDLDKKGVKIGVKTGYTSDTYLTTHLKNAQLTRFSTDSNLLLAVMEGRTTAFASDSTYVDRVKKSYDNKLQVLKIKLPVQKFSVAAKKGDGDLIGEFNRFFQKWKKSGEREKVMKRYF